MKVFCHPGHWDASRMRGQTSWRNWNKSSRLRYSRDLPWPVCHRWKSWGWQGGGVQTRSLRGKQRFVPLNNQIIENMIKTKLCLCSGVFGTRNTATGVMFTNVGMSRSFLKHIHSPLHLHLQHQDTIGSFSCVYSGEAAILLWIYPVVCKHYFVFVAIKCMFAEFSF